MKCKDVELLLDEQVAELKEYWYQLKCRRESPLQAATSDALLDSTTYARHVSSEDGEQRLSLPWLRY